MTQLGKKQRRALRHKLQRSVREKYFRDLKFCATTNQLKQEAKRVADQIMAGNVSIAFDRLK